MTKTPGSATTEALNELAQDAREYLKTLEAYTQDPTNPELRVQLEVQLGILLVHAQSAQESLEEDSLNIPEED